MRKEKKFYTYSPFKINGEIFLSRKILFVNGKFIRKIGEIKKVKVPGLLLDQLKRSNIKKLVYEI